jgi:putative membrane protein
MSKKHKKIEKIEIEEKKVADKKEDKPKKSIKHTIYEMLLYLFSYTITFFLLQLVFKSIRIAEPKLLWIVVAVLIIYALNKVVRPVLVTLTMPITGITFGLFYFVINTLLLKVTDWVMFSKLDFTNIWVLFLISILLSILRFLIEDVILKPIIKRAFR